MLITTHLHITNIDFKYKLQFNILRMCIIPANFSQISLFFKVHSYLTLSNLIFQYIDLPKPHHYQCHLVNLQYREIPKTLTFPILPPNFQHREIPKP